MDNEALLYKYDKIRGEANLNSPYDQFHDKGTSEPSRAQIVLEQLKNIVVNKNFLLQVTFIVIMTMEIMFRKADTTIYMQNYRVILNIAIVIMAAFVFAAIVGFKKYRGTLDSTISLRLLKWYIVMAFMDTTASIMIILASTDVSAPAQTLLAQAVIPLSIVLGVLFQGAKFKLKNYVGALVILVGVALSVIRSFEGNNESTKFGWAICFFCANLPIALGSMFKEMIMSHPEEPAELNSLNMWVAVIQTLLNFALSPAMYILQNPGVHVDVSDLPTNMQDGLKCWLMGHNSITVATPAFSVDDCVHAPMVVWLHILLVVLLNIVALLVIFYGSAVIFFVASACSIPLTTIFSTASFLPDQLQASSLHWEDIMAIILTMSGLILHHVLAPPPPQEKGDDSTAAAAAAKDPGTPLQSMSRASKKTDPLLPDSDML